MKENEKENLNKKENNNKNSMDEKILYEIKFVETEDGYRLEASGDKAVLRKLGIGPMMVGRKRRSGRQRHWRRGRPRHAMPRATFGQQTETTDQPNQPGHRRPGFGSQRRFNSQRYHRHGAGRSGGYPGKGFAQSGRKGRPETWDW